MVTGLAALALIQLVPYGRQRSIPAGGRQLKWDSPTTEQLAQRACFDCHSNQTQWPWYASVAPVSWRIQHDVDEGREHLNFSALELSGEHGDDAREAGETVLEKEMPPGDYRLVHPESRLSPAERRELADGLARSLALSGGEP